MNSTFKLPVLIPVIALLLMCFTATTITATARMVDPYSTIAARLKLEEVRGATPKCWESLLELQSCTAEVVLFFLNGETYLGPGCCRAIRVIQRDCWPTMLGSLGYTDEEGDVLRGYCDAATSAVPPPPPPSPPKAR